MGAFPPLLVALPFWTFGRTFTLSPRVKVGDADMFETRFSIAGKGWHTAWRQVSVVKVVRERGDGTFDLKTTVLDSDIPRHQPGSSLPLQRVDGWGYPTPKNPLPTGEVDVVGRPMRVGERVDDSKGGHGFAVLVSLTASRVTYRTHYETRAVPGGTKVRDAQYVFNASTSKLLFMRLVERATNRDTGYTMTLEVNRL